MIGNLEQEVAQIAFGSLRAGAAFVLAPGFTGARVPMSVRVLASLSIGFLAAPQIPAIPAAGLPLLLAGAGELIVGSAIGLAAQVGLIAVAFAGEMIAAALGLSFATLFDPANGHSTAVGELFKLLGVYLFFGFGGHAAMVEAVFASYRLYPVAHIGAVDGLAGSLVMLAGKAIQAGVMIALPMVTAMLGINIIAGFLTRTAPQLNMFAIAIPMTLVAGLMALWLFADGWVGASASAVERLTGAGFALFGAR